MADKAWTAAWVEAKRQRALAYLGGECARCGSTERLEFDHIDRMTKAFTISANYNRRWEALQAELDKCQLLCHECHVTKTRECGETGGGWNKLDAVPHGTPSGFTYWHCRCADCRKARSEYRRAWAKRTGKPQ